MALIHISTIYWRCAYCNGPIDCRTVDTLDTPAGPVVMWFCHEDCRDAKLAKLLTPTRS